MRDGAVGRPECGKAFGVCLSAMANGEGEAEEG